MKHLEIVDDRKKCERGVLLPDGRVIVVKYRGGGIILRYDTPINIRDGVVFEDTDKFSNEASITLNQIIENGLGKDVFCYEDCCVSEAEIGDVHNPDFKKIAEIIKVKSGFEVSIDGLKHNYACWLIDEKSGYRDEKNGVHIFTPCGCNPLSFRVSTLEDGLDWQKTYSC